MQTRSAELAAPELSGADASGGLDDAVEDLGLRGTALGQTVDRVERHLELSDLRGWDPYDALCSPLFTLPVLRSNRLLRYGAQQTIKRSRLNLRPLLRVPRQLNPVSIGLYLQGQAQRAAGDPSSREWRRDRAQLAVQRLERTATRGYRGRCWGYPFDWETRYASVPAGTPTVVATGMIGNGLAIAYATFGLDDAAELLVGAADFVLREVPRLRAANGSFCWTYGPGSRQAVLNATLKGSRLLAQAHAIDGRDELLDAAGRSVRFAIERQLASGAWPYSVSDPRVDNFHTGYVLECLRAYRRHSGDGSADGAIERGWAYYRRRLFTDDLTPKYYDARVEPLDATACAQAIITLCEFGDLQAAGRVAALAVRRLGLPDGSFAYQRRRGRTTRIPFLRWSTAWMYCALSRLAQLTGPASWPPAEPVR
jgi:hypothetical protein